jgi:hypothetical protein
MRKRFEPSKQKIILTSHALARMSARGVNNEQILFALMYGRRYYVNDAIEFVVGRKDLARAKKVGAVAVHIEGLHVVAAFESEGIHIITVYKNQDMKNVKRRSERRFYRN